MLEAMHLRPQVTDRVPAIPHLDGTARHQTLTAQANPLLHRALTAFHHTTGIPIICNTSLNDKAEPVVNTAAQALTFCINKKLPITYITGRRITLHPTPTTPNAPTPSPSNNPHQHNTQQAPTETTQQPAHHPSHTS